MKAIWNDTLIAESTQTVVVENNHYFPADSVKKDYLVESVTTSGCPWKGSANYYSLQVKNKTNTDAAWCYATAKEGARNIQGYFAFWKSVAVIE
jgi:uncharacterized protein (DUF427 family)